MAFALVVAAQLGVRSDVVVKTFELNKIDGATYEYP